MLRSDLQAPRRSRWATGVVCLLIGALLAISTRYVHDQQGQSSRGSLIDLYQSEQTRLQQTTERTKQLRAQVQAQAAWVQQQFGPKLTPEQIRREQLARQAAGLTPVTGAGLKVTLNDAPSGSYERLGSQGTPDDFVVHQQDVQGVVNALWAGGATAMMVQDQRVIATSAVRCVGSVLLLQDRSYPPPYTITAIGPVERLQQALDQSPSVTLYREYANRLKLEYTVTVETNLTVPAYEGSTGIIQAAVASAG